MSGHKKSFVIEKRVKIW